MLLPKVRHFFARRRSCFIFGSDDPFLPPARTPVCTGKKRKKSFFCYSDVTDSSLRSSSLQMFFKVGVLKMFVFFTTKRSVLESPFLVKLQSWGPSTLIRRESNTGLILSSTKTYLHFSFKRAFQKL